jgi:nicotinamide-nucleotide amidase
MVAEIVSIGTELLLGQIVDTNAAYLARVLSTLGIDLFHQSTVGDNADRLQATLRQAVGRADLILTSGGLGPTQDDLTKESVAEVFDEPLIIDAPSLEAIEAFFAQRSATMPERNRKQAMIYAAGKAIPNPNGTAPGALLEKNGKIAISLPGPPHELVPMVEDFVVPFLAERLGAGRAVLRSRILRFAGIGESALEERIEDLIGSTNPTVAPLAHTGEVHLRITAHAADEDAAEALIGPVERELRERFRELIYGSDDETLETVVVRALERRGMTLAVAESCTGGMLGARLTNVAGSSSIMRGGVIAYSDDVKEGLLDVPPETLSRWGAVSAQTAEAMAVGARVRLRADIGVSITGVAGPGGGSAQKPVGLVFIGLASEAAVASREHRFIGQRTEIRVRAVQAALDAVRRAALEA